MATHAHTTPDANDPSPAPEGDQAILAVLREFRKIVAGTDTIRDREAGR